MINSTSLPRPVSSRVACGALLVCMVLAAGCSRQAIHVKGRAYMSYDVMRPGHHLVADGPRPIEADLTPLERADIRFINPASGRTQMAYSDHEGVFSVVMPTRLRIATGDPVRLTVSKSGFGQHVVTLSEAEWQRLGQAAQRDGRPYFIEVWVPPAGLH